MIVPAMTLEVNALCCNLFLANDNLAGAAGDARVVEQNYLTVASEAIRHRRVPIIHGADVVLVEDDRHTAGLAESAIGEADAVSFDELRRRGLVCVRGHVEYPLRSFGFGARALGWGDRQV